MRDGREDSNLLDLTFLASGRWQHAFTETDDPDGVWVYKIPAAFGQITRVKPFDSILWPRTRFEKGLCLVARRIPKALYNRVRQLSEHMGRRHARRFTAFLKAVEYGTQLLGLIGMKAQAAYANPMRRRKFREMLKLLDVVAEDGLSDILLPFTIVRSGEAVLRVNSTTVRYRGPILVQRKADCVFERGESFRCFDWSILIEAEHRLWRHGLGFWVGREITGPWALLEGRVQVSDTSGLTEDYDRVRRFLSRESLDKRECSVLRNLEGTKAADATEYFRFIRREISQDRLDQLWGADLKAGAGSRRRRRNSAERHASVRLGRFGNG